MEYIILGLLLLQPRTIYQLRKRIDKGLHLMYSCSTGSIQAAIKKLLSGGCISVEEMTENGKLKKIYDITDTGKAKFYAWINSDISCGAFKNPELAKIYFLGFSQRSTQTEAIKNYIKDMEKIHSDLEKICSEGDDISAAMQDNDILFYQLQTAKYGRDLIKFNIDWYTQLLNSISEVR